MDVDRVSKKDSAKDAIRKIKQLRRHWYNVLKDEGFCDIEKLLDNGHLSFFIKRPAVHKRNTFNNHYRYEDTLYFYRLASWFLHDYEFRETIDKQIWELFCEGKTMRQIGDAVSLSVRSIHTKIHKIIRGPFQDYRRMMFHNAN